jgi:hypothetical protein
MLSRKFWLALVCLATAAMAAPTLTTVQDTLYKADGTTFNGTVLISWDSFEGPNGVSIAKQSITLTVTNGFLRVQLVPNSGAVPAVQYKVTYNSDGRMQFYESWSVPASVQPLRVRDVRTVAQYTYPTGGSGSETSGPVQEADVVGLLSDLAARPIKGPGFAAGRVAMVNENGYLESVTGSSEDCVRVDGSSGPCGTGSSSSPVGFVEGDAPSGIVDGSNTIFSLTNLPEPADSLAVYRNGLRLKTGQDYNASGRTLQFVPLAVPQPGDTLLASYRLSDGSSTGQPQLYPASQVVCSGIGGTSNSTTTTVLANCALPAAALLAGDRLEIRMELQHQGTSGYTFDLQWGSTVILTRTAGVSDVSTTGRVDVSLLLSGAQYSAQSWGTALSFAAGVGTASDNRASGLSLNFRGRNVHAGDTLTLQNYTVNRLP